MLKSPSYLRYRGEPLVSTFGGESAGFGGQGWGEWLGSLNRGLGEEVCHHSDNLYVQELITDMLGLLHASLLLAS